MRLFVVIFGLTLMFCPVMAQDVKHVMQFEQTWDDVLKKAKAENKPIFIDISSNPCSACEQVVISTYTNSDIIELYNVNFINYRILPNSDNYSYLISRYNIESYPSYLYIKPDGMLLYMASGALSAADFSLNAQAAIKMRNDIKPIAQWDLEYKSKLYDKQFLYEYIKKCTSLGLDNADAIDKYVTIAQIDEMSKKDVLSLLLEKNKQINAKGAFYTYVSDNRDVIKKVMNYSDKQIDNVLMQSIYSTFNKACETKNEALLEAVIDAEVEMLSATHKTAEIIRNECLTRFYYATKQPVLLSNYVTLYANTILTQKQEISQQYIVGKNNHQEQTNQSGVNKKALFPSSFSMEKEVKARGKEELDVAYSFKLRDAAQYVVEMLSNKRMLNSALVWSQMAIELFDNFSNYETHAYVLYKLGKRGEAIASMEKACAVVPASEGSIREQVEARLIKMKRGERIW